MPMKAQEPTSSEQVAALYKAKRTPNLVEVPELSFLMIDGNGDPTPPSSTKAPWKRCLPFPMG